MPRRARPPALSARADAGADRRLAGFGCVLALLAATLLVLVARPSLRGPADAAVIALLLTALFMAAESSQIHIEIGHQAWSVSLSELPFVLGLFLLPPWWLLLGRLVGAGVVFLLRRTAVATATFNLGLFAAEVAVAELLFQSLHPGAGLHPGDWLIAYLAMLLVAVLGAVAAPVAIALRQGRLTMSVFARVLPVVGLAGILNTTLALLSLLVLQVNRAALLLLAVLVAVVAVGYHAYQRLQRQHADLGRLFAFTQSVGAPETNDGVRSRLLAEAADLMQAEHAVFLPWADTDHQQLPVGAVVIPRGTRDPQLRAWLTRSGLRDALLVPLHDGGHTVGVLQVGNRIGAMSSFTQEDLRLLQTLTAHAEALRSNLRLLELRRHEAHHDSLTGLPNRALFLLRVDELLAAGPDHVPGSADRGAVMLFDIDRFREVNDTLGHQVGDLLLRQIGLRLQAAIPDDAIVARLGGDEFAVLLRRDVEAVTAMAMASDLASSLAEPLEVSGVLLDVAASVGVALIPEDGRGAA